MLSWPMLRLFTDSVISMGEGRGVAGAAGAPGGEGAALAEAVLHLDVEAGQLVIDLGALEIHLELVLELSVPEPGATVYRDS